MKKKESAIEVKVGALVVFSLALLAGFVYLLGDFSFEESATVHVDYQDIAGLKPGAAVKHGGIQVGKVSDIVFMDGEASPTTGEPIWARVTLNIESERFGAIREGTRFFITTEGVLGEKFVSIRTDDVDAAPVSSGHIFRGDDPMRIEEMVTKVATSLDQINEILGILHQSDLPLEDVIRHMDELVVHSDQLIVENRDRIGSVLTNADRLFDTATSTIDENRDALRTTLTDAGVMIGDVRSAAASIKQVSDRIGRDVGPVLERLRHSMDGADRLVTSLLHVSEELEPRLLGLLDEADLVAADVRQTTGQVRELTDHVHSGRGTVGMLLRDEEIFDDLRELLRELKRRPWKIVWKE